MVCPIRGGQDRAAEQSEERSRRSAEDFLGINNYAVAPTHAEVVGTGKQRSLTHAYLASVTFVDHCVGIVLDALKNSPHADNTLIVLWSDHGFHLGEKQHWAKRTLWEESTRVPLLIAGPGVSHGKPCGNPPACSTSIRRSSSCAACRRTATSKGFRSPQLKNPAGAGTVPQSPPRISATTPFGAATTAANRLRRRRSGTLRPPQRSGRIPKPRQRSRPQKNP